MRGRCGRPRGGQRRGKGILDLGEERGDESVRRLVVFILLGERIERGQAGDIVNDLGAAAGAKGGRAVGGVDRDVVCVVGHRVEGVAGIRVVAVMKAEWVAE